MCNFIIMARPFTREEIYKIHKHYQEIPPKVEYSLTEHGKTVNTVLDSVCSWGRGHLEHIDKGEL